MAQRRVLDRPWALRCLGWLIAMLLRSLGRTWRFRFEGTDPRACGIDPNLAAFWHRDLLIVSYLFRDRGYGVAVSRSRDGDLAADVLERLGYAGVLRGSSSRAGTSALRGLLRLVEAGSTVAFPTDGPRGPARCSKLGVVALSRLAQIPVTPLSFSGSPCFRLRSWDQSLLPLPFARVTCRFGPALPVEREATPERETALCGELDQRLNVATDELDARHGLAKRSAAEGPA